MVGFGFVGFTVAIVRVSRSGIRSGSTPRRRACEVRPMDLQLKGKRAVVSGSTAGIGHAIAAALAREAAAVVVNGRTATRVNEAGRRIRADHAGPIVEGVACDLGMRTGADRLLDAVPEADILVNSLGIFEPKSFADIPDEDWLRFFEVNVSVACRRRRPLRPSSGRPEPGPKRYDRSGTSRGLH
jgi:NAD(P)-dependent dehydrogenase (short-subunit alcohol dehydrogenase family)